MNESLKQLIDESKRIVFFGGAGVSTESGIPDFRSEDGLYRQKYDVAPEVILSHTYFMKHPDRFYDFYREKMIVTDALPNAAHRALAYLEMQQKLVAVITQNIDGLHQQAGSQRVYELHGSVHRNFCVDCDTFYELGFIKNSTGVPRCPICGGIIKPDVVLYEEGLDQEVVRACIEAIIGCDLLIVGGTSLTVYPAAGLIDYFHGKNLVLINQTKTFKDDRADLIIRDRIGEVFKGIAE